MIVRSEPHRGAPVTSVGPADPASPSLVVDAARRGDQDAWRALYRAHAGRLEAWLATRRLDDPSLDAQDLAAEAWATAADKLADFRGGDLDFPAWLFGIARNLHRNAARKARRRATDPVASTPDAPDPSAVDLEVEGWSRVRELLALLSPREREVLALTDVVGLSTADAASVLAVSQVAVRVTRHRGLRRLSGTAADIGSG